MADVTEFTGRYPHPAPIDAYGNGGFRFAGMSHRGSILCLPAGIEAWDAAAICDLTPALVERLQRTPPVPAFLLLGTGRRFESPPGPVRAAFAGALISLEVMDTGAAARTYNVLLAEGRPVAAALIAVG